MQACRELRCFCIYLFVLAILMSVLDLNVLLLINEEIKVLSGRCPSTAVSAVVSSDVLKMT